MDRTTRAIGILTLCYLAFGAYAFGVFLQQPLVAGETLSVQAALEPFAYLVCIVVGNLAIFRAVVSRERRRRPLLDERAMLGPALALLLVAAFGAGLHTAGTLVEETFLNNNATTVVLDDFGFRVAYWLEEYASHYLSTPAYVLLLFLLARVDLNREPGSLRPLEKAAVAVCALPFGACLALLSVESAAADLLIVPMNAFLLVSALRLRRDGGGGFWGAPYAAFWWIGTVVGTGLALGFRLTHGWTTQPTDLGFGIAG